MSSSPILGDLSLDAVRAKLTTKVIGATLDILDQTTSTNTAALELAQRGAADGTVVVTDRQTAGRGRLGREWHSPPGGNLYCSVLLRRDIGPESRSTWLSWLPLLTAIAVARALRTVCSLKARLKWPNDILIREKKVGGVLCEGTASGERRVCTVVGIGLNVNTDPGTYPSDFRAHSTSLLAEGGQPINRAELLGALLNEFERCCELLDTGKESKLAEEYRALSATLGQRVCVEMVGGSNVVGRAVGFGSDGSLEVTPDANSSSRGRSDPVVIRAGDVIHLR